MGRQELERESIVTTTDQPQSLEEWLRSLGSDVLAAMGSVIFGELVRRGTTGETRIPRDEATR